uniref:T-cell surface glycoprotein CD3 epsilon chain-like n=1 Tax=Pristiophorus japonicus TaxID=55135 RepID=UPI00398F0AEA
MRTYSGILSPTILLLLGVTASAAMEQVNVEGTTVTLLCPLPGPSYTWTTNDKNEVPGDQTFSIHNYTEEKNGKYRCKSGNDDPYQFYIRAKVCEHCIDLNTGTVIGIICGDLILTLLVAGSVYWFARRQGAASKDFRGRPHKADEIPFTRPADMISPHQNPHYAPIKGGQRDVYDKLNRNY